MGNLSDRPSGFGATESFARCSFCLKNSGDVGALLEGPWHGEGRPAYICRECVEHCARIFANEKQETAATLDETFEGPIDAATQEALKAKIDQVLNAFTEREREIIKLRFGLGDGHTYTLEEIGRLFNLARERVEEIEARAVSKLTEHHERRREENEQPAWQPRLFVEPDPPSP
jgi:hypothetical protein